ncbi:senescence-associated carboxylesterase 101 isoform X2 [Diospyros lotus]|uniref:senescence-associated carboxylesterase 101 isoform X2 n=1 Tax=Diospyros lotus TaxID=55363 RepID=UPI0022548E7C|nr:senescence-associated carboxylesterase 101 isoform X2 [Diospyros lotus]
MNQAAMFSSGLEMGNLVVSSGLLSHSWAAIRELYRDSLLHDPTSPVSIKNKVHQQPPNCTVLAFAPSTPFAAQYLQGEGRDLVSSAALREHFPLFEFVGAKGNPSFSIHRAAVTLFASLRDKLSYLKDRFSKVSRLIVTGHSIGGSIAVLFTLWLLESIPQKDLGSRLCITFGSPLIGDNGFQQAISERPTWNSRFLHVVCDRDPIPRLFVSPRNVDPISNASFYMPFGTFLLCSESGCACFEEPESVLDLMLARMSSGSVGTHGPANGGMQMNGIGEWDYEGILSKIMDGAICWGVSYEGILSKIMDGAIWRGVSGLGEWNFGTLQTGIIIQMDAIEVVEKTQLSTFLNHRGRLQNDDINALTSKIVRRAEDLLASKRINPLKKLNDIKIDMAHIEWYKKATERSGGYYNAFRVEESMRRAEIVKRKSFLTQYWKMMVLEAEKFPQKEGVFSRKAWLLGGTNYRRLVEPLDIAEWYGKGKEDYLANRSEHYKLLEQWVVEYGKLAASQQSNGNVRSRPASLTEDSCFWARVEEAIISCKRLKQLGGGCREDEKSLRESLEKFENHAMELINKYAVSSEIFFKESRFMLWWENYKEIMGSSHHSSLADFMRNRRYKDWINV